MQASWRRPNLGRAGVLAGLGALSAVGHVIYPVALGIATRGRRATPAAAPTAVPAQLPGVSVVVPAYLEQHVIAAKVADIEHQAYAGPVEVIVVADDPETYAAARRTDARVLHSGVRLGKSTAVNRGVRAARHEIVVLTDANTVLHPHALSALVRHFDDPQVGAVAGSKHVSDAAGQGFYWRFESWLKQRESLLGTTMGVVGELAAFRCAAFRPLPDRLVGDDLWLALDFIEQGWRVVFEPAARTTEDGSPRLSVEWERRTRIVAGTIEVIWRRRRLLVPGRSPVAWQLWGHKLLRSTVGPVAHVALLALAARTAPQSRLARAVLVGHVIAAGGLLRVAGGGTLPAPLQVPAQVLFLQAVALAGFSRYLRGDRPALWPKAERIAHRQVIPASSVTPASSVIPASQVIPTSSVTPATRPVAPRPARAVRVVGTPLSDVLRMPESAGQ